MKKLLILASMLLLIGVSNSMAGQADLFSYDAVTIENQMVQMDQLEGYVLSNPGITLTDMTSTGNSLASLVSDPNGISGFNLTNDKAFGIPGFWWGCIIGPFGVLVVYLVAKDSAETKAAIKGCIISAVISIASSVTWSIINARLY